MKKGRGWLSAGISLTKKKIDDLTLENNENRYSRYFPFTPFVKII